MSSSGATVTLDSPLKWKEDVTPSKSIADVKKALSGGEEGGDYCHCWETVPQSVITKFGDATISPGFALLSFPSLESLYSH